MRPSNGSTKGSFVFPPSGQSQRSARFTAETTALSEAVTMFASTPTPHSTLPFTAHYVRGGAGVPTGGERVLGVVQEAQVHLELLRQGTDERVDRAVARGHHRRRRAVDDDVHAEPVLAVQRRVRAVPGQLEAAPRLVGGRQ